MPVLAFSTDKPVPHPAWLARPGIRYVALTASACQALREMLGCDHGRLGPEHVPWLTGIRSTGLLDAELVVLIAALADRGEPLHVRIG